MWQMFFTHPSSFNLLYDKSWAEKTKNFYLDQLQKVPLKEILLLPCGKGREGLLDKYAPPTGPSDSISFGTFLKYYDVTKA